MSYTNEQLVRKFCNNLAAEPISINNNNKTLFIRDRKLFSYGDHYCAATYQGSGIFFINSQKSTPTTERHKSLVRRYAPLYFDVLIVEPTRKVHHFVNYHHLNLLSVDEKKRAKHCRSDERRSYVLSYADKLEDISNDYDRRFL